jgi:hypothetical protein
MLWWRLPLLPLFIDLDLFFNSLELLFPSLEDRLTIWRYHSKESSPSPRHAYVNNRVEKPRPRKTRIPRALPYIFQISHTIALHRELISLPPPSHDTKFNSLAISVELGFINVSLLGGQKYLKMDQV